MPIDSSLASQQPRYSYFTSAFMRMFMHIEAGVQPWVFILLFYFCECACETGSLTGLKLAIKALGIPISHPPSSGGRNRRGHKQSTMRCLEARKGKSVACLSNLSKE